MDDYQFERLWQRLGKYADMLTQFGAVMAPDYSLFTDWPRAIQIYNHYRKHFIGAYLQQLGMTVYPTICWSDKNSYSWCFDGEPENATVCVSSVGTQWNKEVRTLFLDGYYAMEDKLHPRTVVFHGSVPRELSTQANIVQIGTFQEEVRERTRCLK